MLLAGTPRAGPNRADRCLLLALAGCAVPEQLHDKLVGTERRHAAAHHASRVRYDHARTLVPFLPP